MEESNNPNSAPSGGESEQPQNLNPDIQPPPPDSEESRTEPPTGQPEERSQTELTTGTPTYTADESPASVPDNGPAPVAASSPPPKKTGRKWFWRKVALITAVIIILAGASAAAFFTLYLPRQPWYMLDMALKNTMSQNNITANADLNILSTGSSGLAFKSNSTIAANLNAKTVDANLNFNVAGGSLPIELRLVNSNLYFEVGSLSGVEPLFKLAGPNYSALLQTLATGLSGHWFEVDSTLLDASKPVKCLLNTSWALSNSDSSYLQSSYLKRPFFTVNSTSSDTVNGVASKKLNVTMNDNEAAAYIDGFTNLQAVKTYEQCTGSKSGSLNVKSLADNGTTKLTFWIDDSTHRIDQIQSSSADQSDANKLGFQGTVTATLSYSPVNVQSPSGAIPVTQLLAQLEQGLAKDPALQSELGSSLSTL